MRLCFYRGSSTRLATTRAGSLRMTKNKRRAEDLRAPTFHTVLLLPRSRRLRHLVDAVPGCRGPECIVHVVDVLHALVFQPRPEGSRALFGEDGDAVFPGGTSAEHAVELHACLGGELQVLD